MTVQELFKIVDRQRLFELYCQADARSAINSGNPVREVDREIFGDTMDEILHLTPMKCENIDTLIFEPWEGQRPYPEGNLLGDTHGVGAEEAISDWHKILDWSFIIGYGYKQRWALYFTPWVEMVGLSIPNDVIDKYGADIVALNIFWEMVFNGWTKEDHKEHTEEILSDFFDDLDDGFQTNGLEDESLADKPGRRGLFWVICEFDENGETFFPSNSDVQILSWQAHPDTERFYWGPYIEEMDMHEDESDCDTQDFSHEEVWKLIQVHYDNMAVVQEVSAYAWDHFPRGRVEINQGKAFVFYDPALCKMDSFRDRIIHLFSLDTLDIDEVVFGADKKS